MYDGTCLILIDRKGGTKGKYKEPKEELVFTRFATSLSAHAIAYAKTKSE